MRLTIPWKLVLATLIPLSAVALGVGVLAYRSLHQRSSVELEARTQRLAESIAAQLDGQLASAAEVARCTAAFVAAVPSVSQQELGAVLAGAVEQQPIIYGACVAFEPGAFDAQRKLVAPYVFRRDGTLHTMDIGADAYDYTEPRWDWYRIPVETGEATWTEPYFDRGAGDTLMCTYAVPIRRDGRTIGVATVDVPLLALQKRLWIDRFESGSFFVLSSSGTFVSSPDASLVRTTTLAELAARSGRDDLRRLSDLMRAGSRGIMHMDGLGPGAIAAGPTWFIVAPVATPRWSLAVMLPDVDALADERRHFNGSVSTLALATAAILGCVWLAGRRVARPIDDFSRAADAVSRGNLDVVAPTIGGRDELGSLATSFDRMLGELRRRKKVDDGEDTTARAASAAATAVELSRIEEKVELEVAQRVAREVASSGRRIVGPLGGVSGSDRGAHDLAESRIGDADHAGRADHGSHGDHETSAASDASTCPFELERTGDDPFESSGDLLDAVKRRDGTIVLCAIGASGIGIAASTSALAVRMLLRGLVEATDDPARVLAEAARLARGLAQPVSAAVAFYRPDDGRMSLALAGDAGAKLMRGDGEPVTIGRAAGMLGDATDTGAPPPATETTILAPGDRLTMRPRAGRPGEVATWSLRRRA